MLDYFTNKKILITGGCGYLGTHIADGLSNCKCAVTLFDRKAPVYELSRLSKATVRFVQGDITDPFVWEKLLKGIDIVFHLAAQTSSKAANEDPLMDLEVNVKPALCLIGACQKYGYSPDVVFSGTVTEAGVTKEYPVNESVKDDPVTVYDIHKLAAEQYFKFYARTLGRAVTLRLANLYGPGHKSSSADRGVLNMMVRRAIEGQALTVYGDGDFVRDYIYIDDVGDAFLSAAVHMEKVTQGHYVIGSGTGHTFKEMLEAIRSGVQKRLGRTVAIEHLEPPQELSPIEFRNFVADTAAFRSKTEWQPKVSLKEGIERTMEYFLQESAV